MRQSQLHAAGPHFILKQLFQRLHQFELQIFRQSSYIMMRFHHLGRLGSALDDIGINGTLAQEVDSLQLPGLLLEDADKFAADNLPLLFRISHTGKFPQETFGGIHINQIRMKLIPKYLHHTLRLIFAHKPVVDMNTGQLCSDGSDQHGGHYGGIHPAGQCQQYLPVPHLLPD